MSSRNPKAIVVAEHKDGKTTPASLEALNCAYMLTGSLEAIQAVVLAGDATLPAQDLAQYGVPVTGISGQALEHYNGESYVDALDSLVKEYSCPWVILPHTSLGMDLGPALASRLGAAFIPGVQEVRPQENIFVRPIYNGKFSQEVQPTSAQIVCGILPGSFSAVESAANPGEVEIVPYEKTPQRSTFIGVGESDGQDFALGQADTIICAGRGMGDEENIELVEEVAALFPRSAVAGSRIACDMGWLAYKQQIGVTGQTVAPKLYIGCGVSGAFQHVVGMTGSQLVVAVNTDPKAPIFSIADFCIVEDAMDFLPALVAVAGEANE